MLYIKLKLRLRAITYTYAGGGGGQASNDLPVFFIKILRFPIFCIVSIYPSGLNLKYMM